MTNFTAEQIIKINEIFSRVVDCKGNLKVFNGAWDKYKNYTAIYEEDSNGNKSIQATYSTKVSLEDIYNNAKKALSICNVGNIVDINIVTIKTFDISISRKKILILFIMLFMMYWQFAATTLTQVIIIRYFI